MKQTTDFKDVLKCGWSCSGLHLIREIRVIRGQLLRTANLLRALKNVPGDCLDLAEIIHGSGRVLHILFHNNPTRK